MSTRNPSHEAEERIVFEAFLAASPAFANTVISWKQPQDQFPDVIVKLDSGEEIDFEIVEWLDGKQLAQAMRRGRLTGAINKAIGTQGESSSSNSHAVMLALRDDLPQFDPADAGDFHAEICALVQETDCGWLSPGGRQVCEFGAYASLGKYLSAVVFYPLTVAGGRREWIQGKSWIFVKLPSGSYGSDWALDILHKRLQHKIAHYGGLARPVRLLVHYGKAAAYNTPYQGIEISEFRDVAAASVSVVANQRLFQKIYLLSLEPGVGAFEIFPDLAKCE